MGGGPRDENVKLRALEVERDNKYCVILRKTRSIERGYLFNDNEIVKENLTINKGGK